MRGNAPVFDIKKQFEVEVSEQLLEYFKTQVMKIDLIDESVDLREGGQSDYIGSVRIPLRELLINEEFADSLPVKDEMGIETGRMEVKMSCKDYSIYPYAAGGLPQDSFTMSRFAEKDLINQISEKFAQTPIEDIDLLFDMLIEGDYSERITKKRFKDYLLTNFNMKEQDIDILLKTNTYTQGKDYIEKNDFRNMFEQSVREARQRLMQSYNEQHKRYQAASNYFRTGGGNVPINPFDQSIN